jgi:predicted RNA-binding Zn-ribbon protein involved in translation (DUF1610 family)
MGEKIMLCIECGKLFRVNFAAEELKCPGCGSDSVDSIYRHYNLMEEAL